MLSRAERPTRRPAARGLPIALAAAALALTSAARPARAQRAPGAGPVPGTYLCWSARLSELLAQDAQQAAAASGPRVLPDRIIESVTRSGTPLKYLVRGDGTFADVTYGDAYARNPKYNGRYAVQGSLIRLTVQGTPLFTFRRARSADGTELLQQVRETPPADPYVSTQLCRRTDGARASAPAPRPTPLAGAPTAPTAAAPTAPAPAAPAPAPAEAPAGAPTLVRGHPNRTIAYPGNVMLDFEDYAKTPGTAVVELTFTPVGGGTPLTFRRTVLAIRTQPAFDDSRPLDQTGYLTLLAPGAFRVRADLLRPDGERRPLKLRTLQLVEGTEVELRWSADQRYRDGGKVLSLIVDPPR